MVPNNSHSVAYCSTLGKGTTDAQVIGSFCVGKNEQIKLLSILGLLSINLLNASYKTRVAPNAPINNQQQSFCHINPITLK